MNYYHLKSVIAAGKETIPLSQPMPSFYVNDSKAKAYIEPGFEKVIFETEKPTVILVSAIGATGKSALAHELSHDLKLPLLDLAQHKPVGANTLTGLLTDVFDVKDISRVFAGLSSGSYGIIVDGIDEGRSKTTDKAFEAFLDDIAKFCRSNSSTTFILLGRTQIVDTCWDYLVNKNISTALITISPFTLNEAKKYIDTFTAGQKSSSTYVTARDVILDKLSRAFAGTTKGDSDDFLSFIGYPPVLDAIATLLSQEQNYHKLLQSIENPDGENVEIVLLNRISKYILDRERDFKVIPNILNPILGVAPEDVRKRALSDLFSIEEQSIRLVAYCLGKQTVLNRLGIPVFDEQYEKQLSTWLPEHPFLSRRKFRNSVFEGLILATLIISKTDENLDLANEYIRSHKQSYHLVYMLDIISTDRRIPVRALTPLFTSAMEFRSVRSVVELRVEGPEWEDDLSEAIDSNDIDIEIEVIQKEKPSGSKTFSFLAEIKPDSCLNFGSRLGGAFISVPCDVRLESVQELELSAPVEISAKSVFIDAKELILRVIDHDKTYHSDGIQAGILIETDILNTQLESITTNGVLLDFSLKNLADVTYPVIQYVQKAARPLADPLFKQKYFRLKRILMAFRSHSKGSLARYQDKIEHERVIKNDIGRAVLKKLVEDKILELRGKFYHLNPEKLSLHMGISWHDLRRGLISSTLESYIKSID